MKKFLLFALVFSGKLLLAQNNNFNNTTSLNCSLNTFWAVGTSNFNSYEVSELNINNNIISLIGIATPSIGAALGVSNNLNGGSTSPTFYSELNDTLPYYYNTSGWVSCGIADTLYMRNCGGFGNNIYYTGLTKGSFYVKHLVRYNGVNLNLIYNTPINTSIAVADVAVDANNNVWFFTLEDSLIFFASKLNVIDVNGNLLQQYNTNFDITNAFGMCIINDSIYVGFGYQNTSYPNMLVSIAINGNNAFLNNAVTIPIAPSAPLLVDLASCNPGIPTGFKEIKKTTEASITLYPNPAVDKITIGNLPANAKQLCITNSMGAVVWQQALKNEKEVELNTSRFALGMYAVCVKTDKAVLVKKMVKL